MVCRNDDVLNGLKMLANGLPSEGTSGAVCPKGTINNRGTLRRNGENGGRLPASSLSMISSAGGFGSDAAVATAVAELGVKTQRAPCGSNSALIRRCVIG